MRFSVSEFFHLPQELVLDDFVLHILGNHHVIVENYKCIQRFACDCIIIKGKKQKIGIRGTNLRICSFGENEIELTGNISDVTWKN